MGWVPIVSTVLAIDTSTSQTSVAVVKDGQVLFTQSHNCCKPSAGVK